MSISTVQLAKVVTGLLVKPELVEELATREAHNAFIEDIAKVVAAHCGGHIQHVSNEGRITVISDSTLPSPIRHIWAIADHEDAHETYDREAAVLMHSPEYDSKPAHTIEEISNIKAQIHQLLAVES